MLATALVSLSLWPYAPEDDADATLGMASHSPAADAGGGALVGSASPALAADVADDDEDDARPWTALARITSYCHAGVMRSGRWTYVGAVATDRRYIPEGSLLEIEGVAGTWVSEDTGSGVLGWWVDVYRASCVDALAWGSQQRAVRVTRWGW